MTIDPRLQPPQTKGNVSIAELDRFWYVGCLGTELRRKPIARTILGIPMVLYRDDRGRPAALLDRCPHRNVPLSMGRVVGANLECSYHGWQFDGAGECRAVPGLCGDPEHKGRRVEAFPCIEQDGFVWVFPNAEEEPLHGPYPFPIRDDTPGYTVVRRMVEAEGTVHQTIENALDVPHTAFLHAGLFRNDGDRSPIQVVVRRWSDRVEAEYIGEARPEGLVGRMLSPSGGVVTHFDRFILPSLLQVEYRIGEENHILVTAACTPVGDFHTRLYALVAFRTRLPGWALKPLVQPFALMIFGQDAKMLKLQTDNIRRFGGEQFVSTDIDVLGSHIWRLMRQAERGQAPDQAEPVVKELTMMV